MKIDQADLLERAGIDRDMARKALDPTLRRAFALVALYVASLGGSATP
jgi:hypothetical protein